MKNSTARWARRSTRFPRRQSRSRQRTIRPEYVRVAAMPEFVIEKSMPGLGKMTPFQRDLAVRRSCSTLHGVAPGVAWVQSYLADDKCYCVFRAPSAQTLYD